MENEMTTVRDNTKEITPEIVQNLLDNDDNCEFPGVNLMHAAPDIARAFLAKCEELKEANEKISRLSDDLTIKAAHRNW